jgi:hypothetical protein
MAFLKKVTYFVFLLFILLGCSKDKGSNCFTRQGNIVSVERILEGNVTILDVRDNVKLTIKQGPEFKAIVRGGENLLDSYITKVEGNKLIFENLTSCKWTRDLSTPFEVILTIPEIKEIYYTGFGGIYSEGPFNCDTLLIDTKQGVGNFDLELNGKKLDLVNHTGSMQVKIKGSYDYVYCYAASQSIIDMSKLVVKKGFYASLGTGDVTINTSDYIKVILDLTGSIYYTNNPEIYIESQKGSGELIHY